MSETSGSTTFGPNAWLVDEMHDQYLEDPSSVSESWQDFFADYRKDGGRRGDGAPAAAAPSTTAPPAPEQAAPAAPPPAPGPQQAQASAAPAAGSSSGSWASIPTVKPGVRRASPV